MQTVIHWTDAGLYCPAGDFYIDPREPVEKALITHGHSDHARRGMGAYMAAELSLPILHHRLGNEAVIRGVPFGEPVELGDVLVSFHPAGHILGSAQIRVETGGDIWVVSGDYKRLADPTCQSFEVMPCDVFITEATFGLPVYCWDDPKTVTAEIFDWWEQNRTLKRTSILFCYALGKAQRILAELGRLTDRPVYLHESMQEWTDIYRRAGVAMAPTLPSALRDQDPLAGELVLAPVSAHHSPWMKRFDNFETGFASGWMRVGTGQRCSGYDRGFILSDHAGWPELLQTVRETGAKKILAMPGHSETLVRYLRKTGRDAETLGG